MELLSINSPRYWSRMVLGHSDSGDRMRRREFIWLLSGVVVWAVTAHAQGNTRPRKLRVGWLVVAPNPFIIHFRRGMAELGHIEGVDYVLEESDARQPDRSLAQSRGDARRERSRHRRCGRSGCWDGGIEDHALDPHCDV